MRRVHPYTKMSKLAMKSLKRAEAKYWVLRDDLIKIHYGKWVVVSEKGLISVGDNPLDATLRVSENGTAKAYINRVGFEDSTNFKIRRISFPYDQLYPAFPLPRAKVTVYNIKKTKSKEISDIIPDTGADISCLHHSDCIDLKLLSAGYYLHNLKRHGEDSHDVILVNGYIEIDGKKYKSLIELVNDTDERLLGRDVLNQLKAIFDGRKQKVTFE